MIIRPDISGLFYFLVRERMKAIFFAAITITNLWAANLWAGEIPNLDLRDLRGLKALNDIVGDAHIVGLGESAHGSMNYIKAQSKIARYLIEKKGFRTVLSETGYIKAEPLKKLIKNCANSLPARQDFIVAMASIEPTDNNLERLEFYEYLCEFSHKTKEQIHFGGLDIWTYPWEERERIKGLESKAGDEIVSKLYNRALKYCWVWSVDSWEEASELAEYQYVAENWRIDPERHIPCLGALRNLNSYINKRKKELSRATSLEIVNSALRAIENQILYQDYRDLYEFKRSLALTLRDAQQARHVKHERLEAGNSKTIIIGHNVHISKNQFKVVPPEPGYWDDVRSLGERLVARHGEGYKAIALSGLKVSSSKGIDYPIPSSEESLDLWLSQKYEYALISAKRFDKPWWMHWESFINGSYLIPGEQYDGIFFTKESPAATPISSLD